MLPSQTRKLSLVKAYDAGAQTVNTDDVLEDIPQLSTLKRNQNYHSDLDYLQRAESTLPTEIKLRLILRPVVLIPKMITAQLKQDTRLLATCHFYNVSSLHRDTRDIYHCTLWSGIDLLFEGTAFYNQKGDERPILITNTQFELMYKKNQLIERYNFVLPDQTHYLQSNVHYRENYCITHLDDRIQGINVSPLIPYGGYIERPLNVSAICQTYAFMSEAPDYKTQLALYTQHYCNKNNIHLSTPQDVTPYRLCADPKYLPTIRLTLAGWLMMGCFKIKLMCKLKGTQHIYHSINYKQTDFNTGTVDVLFVKND